MCPLPPTRDVSTHGRPVRANQKLSQGDQAHTVEPSLEEVATPQVIIFALGRAVLQEVFSFLQALLTVCHTVSRACQDSLRTPDKVDTASGSKPALCLVSELFVMVGRELVNQGLPLRHHRRVRKLKQKRADLQVLEARARKNQAVLTSLQRAQGAAKRSAKRTQSILEAQATCEAILIAAKDVLDRATRLEDDLLAMDALQTEVARLRREQGAQKRGVLLYGVPLSNTTTFWNGRKVAR